MTGPLRQPTPIQREDDPFDPDNLVPGTSLSRLAAFIRNTTPPGEEDEEPTATFSSSPAEFVGQSSGVPNPYGQGLEAYEPNTVLFDDYANAYNKVQEEKIAEAQQQLLTFDFSAQATAGGGGSVTGVPFANLFTQAGNRYGVPPALLAAVARAESNFQTNARSPAGALGLMQFMPGTAATFGVNPFDPASAIDGAARYLKRNFDRFGTWDLALAAYNAGEGAVSRYGGIPPFAETQNYVRRVNAYYQEYGAGGHMQALVSPGGGAPGVNFAGGGLVNAGGRVRGMVSAALSLAARRVPYVWGGTSASGVDCSGLIYYAARSAGIDWKRYRAVDYGRMGTAVSLSQARPGDIVYYDNPGDTDHVGIYIGNGQMVQSPFSGQTVQVTGVGNFTSIRRIFDDGAFSAGVTPYGAATPLYNGMTYDPFIIGTLINTPVFGGTIGRAVTAEPKVIERTQQTGRIKAI